VAGTGCRVVVSEQIAQSTGHACRVVTPCLLLAVVCLTGCADAEKERLMATTQPTYDKATGRLTNLTYDANRNGRIDTWTEMDGTRPLRSRIDRNEDGTIDRWEYYDEEGQLVKVGFSRHDDGKLDAWAFAGSDGKVHRIEISSTGDENGIDRWEYYDPARGDAAGYGALVRAEEDIDADARPDKWETYKGGAIETVAFDEDGDGIPDRRISYQDSEVAVVDSLLEGTRRSSQR